MFFFFSWNPAVDQVRRHCWLCQTSSSNEVWWMLL